MSEAADGGEITALLGHHIGLDPASIGASAVNAAVRARRTATGATTEAAYAGLLRTRPDELRALIEELVVPETWFMRDRAPFANLAAHALATRAARGEGPLRVLSAPCSTGEEPYSIAMALLDVGFAPTQFHIDAVDVSHRALAVAARATYGASSFRGDEISFRERHCRVVPDGWEVLPEARASVFFRHGNLLDPGGFEMALRYHAIFCRNLLIYLTPAARALAIARLEALLEPGGLFIAGHAEGLQVMDRRFRAVEVAGAFTFVRAADVRARRASAAPPPRAPSVPAPVPPRDTTRMHAFPARQAPSRRPAHSGVPSVVPPPAPPRDLLAEAAGLADRGDLAAAGALCDEHLRDHPDAPGYALLGTIRQAGGRLEDAEAMFSRALYCDPGHYESLVHLALLRERRGDRAGAENLRRRAAKARRGGER